MDPASERVAALLAPLTNYERTRPDRARYDLAVTRRLLARPDAPDLSGMRLVQIGGSKGKGTTAAYLDLLARQTGLRVGVYASPHVSSLLERVRLDGRDVGEEPLTDELRAVLAFARGEGLQVSFFEAMTVAALGCFAGAGVDLGVLEVGLGGRLDATTAVDVDASILTGVELEHTEVLGETVEQIAAEKAWILRPERPGFVAAEGPARRVVAEHARAVGAELHVFGLDFGVDPEPPGDDRRLRLWARGRARCAGQTVRLRGAPAYEDRALALAWACLDRLWPGRGRSIAALRRPELPGRFEVLTDADGWPLVLDGAHTPESAALLAGALRQRFPGQRFAVLFASARGKRWREVLSQLLPIADRFVVMGVSGTQTEDPETIRSWLARAGRPARAVSDMVAGLRALRSSAIGRVVTGSFYLVGDARESAFGSDMDGS